MGAVRMCVASEFRRRWRSWLGAGVLTALIGALVLATAAGARRADSAYARFLRASRASSVIAFPERADFDAAVARLHGVAAVAPVEAFNAPPVDARDNPIDYLPVAGLDDRFGSSIDRPKIIAGRLPRTANEAAIDTRYRSSSHAAIGDVLTIPLVPSDPAAVPSRANTHTYRVRVVGVIAVRNDAVVITRNDAYGTVLLSPALQHRVPAGYDTYTALYVRTTPGASAERVGSEITALGAHMRGIGGQAGFIDEAATATRVEHAMRPEPIALAIFSLLAALTGVLALSQVLSRQLDTAGEPFGDLRALGMSRGKCCTTALLEVSIVAGVGAMLAGVLAVLASPAALFGAAKVVEPHPGVRVDRPVLLVGVPAMVLVLAGMSAWQAWRISARPIAEAAALLGDTPTHLGRVSRLARGRPSQRVGIGFALDGRRGQLATPVRSALTGGAIAIAAVTATFTFGANLVHLVRTPKQYGQTWDVMVDAGFGSPPASMYSALLRGQPGVRGWTLGDYATIATGKLTVPGIALFPSGDDTPGPLVLAGRAPQRDDEIALGAKTIAALHTRVGGVIVVPVGPVVRHMTVVGRAVFPAFGEGSFAETALGQGALLWGPQFTRLVPSGTGNGNGGAGTANFALVQVTGGPDHDADVAHLIERVRTYPLCAGHCATFTTQRPVDVADYVNIESTPSVLVVALSCFAVASLAHFLVTSVRRRRRDIAVLKTLGFVRAQVSAAVAWQATAVAVLAIAIGVPAGIVAGHWLWDEFATRLGVAPGTRLPTAALVAAGTVAIVVANALSAGPGYVAARLRPAAALRDE